MLKSKAAFLVSSVLVFTRGVFGQQTPVQTTMYIPLVNEGGGLSPDEVVSVSSISVQDSSTVFQIIDTTTTGNIPASTFTLTMGPTAVRFTGSQDDDGNGGPGSESFDALCTINSGQSSCQLTLIVVANGTTQTSTGPFTETAAPITVFAVNFATATTPLTSSGPSTSNTGPTPKPTPSSPTAGSGSSSSSSSSSTTDTSPSPTQTSSAPTVHISLAFICTIAFGLALQFV